MFLLHFFFSVENDIFFSLGDRSHGINKYFKSSQVLWVISCINQNYPQADCNKWITEWPGVNKVPSSHGAQKSCQEPRCGASEVVKDPCASSFVSCSPPPCPAAMGLQPQHCFSWWQVEKTPRSHIKQLCLYLTGPCIIIWLTQAPRRVRNTIFHLGTLPHWINQIFILKGREWISGYC